MEKQEIQAVETDRGLVMQLSVILGDTAHAELKRRGLDLCPELLSAFLWNAAHLSGFVGLSKEEFLANATAEWDAVAELKTEMRAAKGVG